MSGCTGKVTAGFRHGLLALLLMVFLSFEAAAAGNAVRCIMTGEDVGNGYEYTAPGIGSFTVNGMEGETLPAAVFSVDEGCFPVLYRDGEPSGFSHEMVIDNGSYELRLYRNEDHEGDYGTFSFTVKNDYAEFLGTERKEVQIVENPPLEMEYDAASGFFRYTLPDGKWFKSNVPAGGWFRGQADIIASSGLNIYQVRRDGKMTDFLDGLNFNETGSYEIVARDNELGLEGEISYQLTIGFHLYLDREMDLNILRAPQGLTFARVQCDGRPVKTQGEYLFLKQDGDYHISFADSTGRECWSMEFTRDTVPPALSFDRAVDGQVLTEEVSFQNPDPGVRVDIFRGGEPVEASRGTIAVNGVYQIEASDGAGNVRDYHFTIQTRHAFPKQIWLIIPLTLFLGIGAGLICWRRNMKVL